MKGNARAAKESFLNMRALNQALFLEPNPVPIKKAMNMIGIEVGGCRLPLTEMEEVNVNILKDALNQHKLLEEYL